MRRPSSGRGSRRGSASTETGDRSEIDLPDQFATWRDLSATADTCLGRECPFWDECFVTKARARAASADVLLVNHHLFFADLAMRTSRAGVEVLPEYDAVVFDEAHALEDVATDYFGLQVSSFRVEELVRDALRAVADRPDLASMLREQTGELRRAGERFFGALADGLRGRPSAERLQQRRAHGQRRTPDEEEGLRATIGPDVVDPLAPEQARLDDALGTLRDALTEAESPALAQIARRAGELRVELLAVTAMKEPSRVYFAEVRGRGVFLRAAPIDVAEELVERLYRRTDTVVFTSATLAAQGKFDFFRRQMGLSPDLFEVEEARYDGPFDYSRQAALVAPEGLPEPNAPGFIPAAAEAIRELTAITGGRAFVLCTSIRNMQALYAASRGLPYRDPHPGGAPEGEAAAGVPGGALGPLRDPELLGRGRRPRGSALARHHRPPAVRAAQRPGHGGAGEGAGGGGEERLR